MDQDGKATEVCECEAQARSKRVVPGAPAPGKFFRPRPSDRGKIPNSNKSGRTEKQIFVRYLLRKWVVAFTVDGKQHLPLA